ALQDVAGVAGIDITTLNYKSASDAASHGAAGDPVQLHLRIGDAGLAPLEEPAHKAIGNPGTSPTGGPWVHPTRIPCSPAYSASATPSAAIPSAPSWG